MQGGFGAPMIPNQMQGPGGPQGGFPAMPGNFMNSGLGPNMQLFPNQNGTTSPPIKRDRGTQYSLYIGNLSKEIRNYPRTDSRIFKHHWRTLSPKK